MSKDEDKEEEEEVKQKPEEKKQPRTLKTKAVRMPDLSHLDNANLNTIGYGGHAF